MLFQRQGGLQIQILETISELNKLGVQAELINPNSDKLADFDVIHVFSAINGTYRLLEAAKGVDKPTVLSPLIQPDWTSYSGMRARFFEKLIGKMTGWHIRTTYHEIETSLRLADALVALGDIEKDSITNAFRIPAEKTNVIPNGIPPRFFSSEPMLFIKHFGIDTEFILCVAGVNSYKNQLSLAKALEGTQYTLVLIGQCLETNKDYLAEIQAYSHVTYLGSMDYSDPMLASAYSAAKIFCLPSNSEVMPLCVLEALAAGTPVVMTRNHCMDMSQMKSVIKEIEPTKPEEIRACIIDLIAQNPDVDQCRKAVIHLSWKSVAQEIHKIYLKLTN